MWEISVGGQVSACVYSVVLGALLCVFYDIIRATRKAGANSHIAVFAGDILFWLISALSVFIFLIAVTNGEIRGYVLLSCMLGFIIYRLTLGRLTFLVMCWFLSLFVRVWRKLSGILANICCAINDGAERFFVKIIKGLSQVFRYIKKLLKNTYSMLYTMIHKSKLESDVNE